MPLLYQRRKRTQRARRRHSSQQRVGRGQYEPVQPTIDAAGLFGRRDARHMPAPARARIASSAVGLANLTKPSPSVSRRDDDRRPEDTAAESAHNTFDEVPPMSPVSGF